MAAELHQRRGENGQALTALRRVQKLEPESPRPYLLIAQMQIKSGKTAEAIKEYQALLKKKPGLVPARMKLGVLLEHQGKIDAAKAAYQAVLQVDPQFAPAANNLAWLLTSEKNPDLGNALRLALIAKKKKPEDPFIADTLGWIHYQRGSYDLAVPQFSQALAKLPKQPTIHYHLALALKAVGKKEEARQELSSALKLKGDFPERQKAEELLNAI
jgi:Flp pilus assembly protein TadD